MDRVLSIEIYLKLIMIDCNQYAIFLIENGIFKPLKGI